MLENNKPTACVKVNGSLSQEYIIERGVRQGSVLSPSLFLLLIDSLLQALKEANAGVNLEGVYMGSLAHADDLRSLTLDPQSSKQQAEIIDDFLAKNVLQFNTNKCELVVNAHGTQSHTISVDVGDISLEPSHASKCLGSRGHGGLQILVQRKQSWRISVVPVERSSHLGALEFFMVI